MAAVSMTVRPADFDPARQGRQEGGFRSAPGAKRATRPLISVVTSTLNAADLMLVRVEEGLTRLPFVDVAQGLVEPESGRVMFLGEDWCAMPAGRSAERRGKIGRVFESHAWISNLDVDENVTLAQRHHTLRPEGEIAAEADALAAQFGLRELPHVRPAVVRRADLRRAEWVRAFLGEPRLIILENPTRDVPADALTGLAGAVMIKIQHPETELFSSGIHARSGRSVP